MTRLFSRFAAILTLLATCAAVLVTVATAAPASAYANDLLRLEGHGWGHGRGLGQYGSYGYAVDEGKTYDWILDHFYGGTTPGTVATSDISVRLTEFDSKDMIVISGSPYTISGLTFAAGEAALVRHTATGADVSKGTSCGGPWTKYGAITAPTTPTAVTTYGGDDVKLMLRACGPTGNLRSYRGSLSMVASGANTWVVNILPMEQYLRGVVPRESPASWGDAGGGKGLEALKAQAVAARSYAYAENRNPGLFKTCDTISCQVYGGAGLNGVRIEDSRSDAAVSATSGQVRITSTGSVARTEFSSSTGGYTAGGNFTAVPDTGDDTPANPNHNWVSKVPTATVEAAYPSIGKLQAVQITKRNSLGADGGRAVSVKLTGTSGSTSTTGDSLRSKLGLKSDWFTPVDIALDVRRVAGEDRYATAASVSSDVFAAGSAQSAVLVSATNFPDALVGVPLAVAKGGPILLSDQASVPAATMTELQRATGGPGKTVYLLGGTAALGDGVVAQLQAAGYQVVRYGGATRYATAVLVAQALGDPTTVLEASGTTFPEALVAGPAAAKAKGAVLLTAGPAQAPETAAYLNGRTVTRYAIGADASTADPSATALKGSDRYSTAVAVANNFFPGPVVAGLASGTVFPDALGGGVHAAMKGGPLLLTASTELPITTKQYLQGNSDVTLRDLVVYGGTAAVSDQVLTDLKKR